jgi:hypothetical protein
VQFLREALEILDSAKAALMAAVQFIEAGDPIMAPGTEERQ